MAKNFLQCLWIERRETMLTMGPGTVLSVVIGMIIPSLIQADIFGLFLDKPPSPKFAYFPPAGESKSLGKWCISAFGKPVFNPRWLLGRKAASRSYGLHSTTNPLPNAWEKSGLLEGDIMTAPKRGRNGLKDPLMHWPDATVPYYIDDSFSKSIAQPVKWSF